MKKNKLLITGIILAVITLLLLIPFVWSEVYMWKFSHFNDVLVGADKKPAIEVWGMYDFGPYLINKISIYLLLLIGIADSIFLICSHAYLSGDDLEKAKRDWKSYITEKKKERLQKKLNAQAEKQAQMQKKLNRLTDEDSTE